MFQLRLWLPSEFTLISLSAHSSAEGWRKCFPPKHRMTFSGRYIPEDSTTAVITLNPTQLWLFLSRLNPVLLQILLRSSMCWNVCGRLCLHVPSGSLCAEHPTTATPWSECGGVAQLSICGHDLAHSNRIIRLAYRNIEQALQPFLRTEPALTKRNCPHIQAYGKSLLVFPETPFSPILASNALNSLIPKICFNAVIFCSTFKMASLSTLNSAQIFFL